MSLRTLALVGLLGCYRSTTTPAPSQPVDSPPVDPAALRQQLLDASAGKVNLWRLVDRRAGLVHINTHEAAYVDDAEMIEQRLCGDELGRFIGEMQLLHFDRVIRERAEADQLSCEATRCFLASMGEGSPSYALTFTRDGKRLVEIVVTDTSGATETWLEEQSTYVNAARERQRSTKCR